MSDTGFDNKIRPDSVYNLLECCDVLGVLDNRSAEPGEIIRILKLMASSKKVFSRYNDSRINRLTRNALLHSIKM